MTKLPNGFYSYSDGYLNSMNKQGLINYIRTIEKNWENALITNEIQYTNCKQLLAEERNKAINEFVERLKVILKDMQILSLQGEDDCPHDVCPYDNQSITCEYCIREQTIKDIERIAEEMRGAE